MAHPVEVLSWVLILAGSVFVVIGGVGLLRLPDFYTRIHAAGITDTLGSWLIVIGLILHEGLTLNAAKLVMLLFLLLATSPLASHALAKAAYLRGLDPLQGRELVDRHEVDDRG
ncbi:MAG TPA: monovalent cation/H(+) antiporter subunit G [Candidatus Sulfomarinibacteraceae bacterium]|jgi:multicomponent Na+:H+ antiporter subunit G|nr:monovalent cation/H(+) antiporter subunit G [Candidatus Sulfomarinibacteraceae bacterium]